MLPSESLSPALSFEDPPYPFIFLIRREGCDYLGRTTDVIAPLGALPGVTWRQVEGGFQLILARDDTVYTALYSTGAHFRSEVVIIRTSMDGDCRLVARGSICAEDDQDVSWIADRINQDLKGKTE
jgi:hypothetical protein